MMQFFSDLLHLPVLASENGRDVDNLIIYVHWLMILLFVGWFGYFLYCLFRFSSKRNPKADHVGVRSHMSNYIEIGVIVAEARWVLYFLPLEGFFAGVFLLLVFYLTTGVISHYLTDHLEHTVMLEFALVTAAGLAIVIAGRVVG